MSKTTKSQTVALKVEGSVETITRLVDLASQFGQPVEKRVKVVQNSHTGTILGSIVFGKNGPGFSPDGTQYVLSAKALREIATHIDLFGVSIAS